MKKKHIQLGVIAALLCTTFACEPPNKIETGNLELNFRPKVSGQSFEPGIIYTDLAGRKYILNKFKFLNVGLQATKSDGTPTYIDDSQVFRIAGTERIAHGGGVFKTFPLTAGDYKGLYWDVGATAAFNYKLPSESKGEGLQDESMFISSSLGRKFIVLSGKIDTSKIVGQTEWKDFEYTVADTIMRRKMEIDSLPKHAFSIVGKKETQFIVEIDLNQVLKGVWSDSILLGNVSLPYSKDEKSTAAKIADNFVNSAMYKVEE
ncbi:MAG: MbnP family protein [Bacteroidia bacterium]